jgi:hypothetical protein
MGTTETPMARPRPDHCFSLPAALSWLVVLLALSAIAVIVFLLLGGQLGP